MFREDPLLAWLALGLSAVSVAPMFFTPFLPLVDLGSHVGAAGLLPDVLLHRGIAPHYYTANPLPVPYWSGYVLLTTLHVLVGPFAAAKVTTAITVLLLPLGHMRLLAALERSPRLGLWAFALAWNVNTYWGWFTFQLGMTFALYAIAWLVEAQSVRDAPKIAAMTALVALSHPHAAALLAVAAVALFLVGPMSWRSLLRYALGLSGSLVTLPWLIARLHSGGSGGPLHYEADNPPEPEKVASLYRYSVDVFTKPDAVTVTCLAFLLCVLGPAVLGGLRRRPVPDRSTARALALLGACVALYLLLPFQIRSPTPHWWTYPRYATYILLALLLCPAPDLRGARALVLAPGVVVTVALAVARIHQFSDYGDRTRPYLAIVRAMKPDSTFLPLDFDFGWSGTREASLGQLHGYAAAATSSVDPHLFDEPNMPLLFRPESRLPVPADWRTERIAGAFGMEEQGRFYDYIVTHPRRLDVVASLPRDQVELLVESGEWRLYAVRKPWSPHGVVQARRAHRSE
jgi:hypothetical protein